jgi:ATP phosphoribosyltransferase
LGVTGEDLVREQMPDADERVDFLLKLGFGHADVVVAVPACWLDVETMADLEAAAAQFAIEHGRRMRIATKYPVLTRRFFTSHGVVTYRTVESLGATEGAPAVGSAEAIVDITSTGATLKANGLRVLKDGLILRSQANLVASRVAPLADGALAAGIVSRLTARMRG